MRLRRFVNEKGVYTLIINIAEEVNLNVGSLHSLAFKSGWYTYTGSALAQGGLLGRIGRHLRKNKKCFWHIDYVLTNGLVKVKAVVHAIANENFECVIAKAIAKECGKAKPITGFGVSDCTKGCRSHLHFFPVPDFDFVLQDILDAYKSANLMPKSFILKS